MKANYFHTESKHRSYSLLHDGNGKEYDPHQFILNCVRPSSKHNHHVDWVKHLNRQEDFAELLFIKVESENRVEQFEKAARNKNHQELKSLIDNMDLSCYSPNEITLIIDCCLSLDLISTAFELAKRAMKLYPENKKLESAYKALSPPRVIGTRPAQAKGIEESQKWFSENSYNYKGKWVAVNNGELLGVAESLDELNMKINENHTKDGTIIDRIIP